MAGVVLKRVVLALLSSLALLALASGCGGRSAGASAAPGKPEHRLLVVGWDGADWRQIDPLLEAGRLPHLARLLARGVQARCQSTLVPISSSAWVGAFTGKHPGKSGVYAFF